MRGTGFLPCKRIQYNSPIIGLQSDCLTRLATDSYLCRTDPSISALLPPARPSLGGNPVSPSTTIRDNYATSTPGLQRHMISPRSHVDSLTRSSYNSVPDTPRSMIPSANMSLSPSYGGGSGLSYQNSHEAKEVDTPPFSSQEDFHEILCDGHVVKPSIDAKIEKGFFYSNDHCWTCYRRNYFSVQCSYTLTPHLANRTMYLSRAGGKGQEQIQAMAICLSAAVDGSTGKNIELVQHTPKRDKGPQTAIQITKLAPTPPGGKLPGLHHTDSHGYTQSLPPFGQPTSNVSAFASPYLPLQGQQDASSSQHHDQQQSSYSPQPISPTAHQHTFERIQFKSATANNGKRRAQQQYYHLIIELFVDVRHNLSDRQPNWVKVAQRASSQVVVRGRSPSHYSNEGPHSAGSHGAGGAPGGTNMGPMGSSASGGFGPSYGRALGSGFSYGISGGYRAGNQFSHDFSPVGSKSESSASSISGGPVDAFPEQGRVLSSNVEDEDGVPVDNFNSYQYFPGPLYEAGLPPPIKSETHPYATGRVKEEGGFFSPGSLFTGGRFQGVDTSRGFYTADAVY
jgi:meiosis-specific transcription factor NDT80